MGRQFALAPSHFKFWGYLSPVPPVIYASGEGGGPGKGKERRRGKEREWGCGW